MTESQGYMLIGALLYIASGLYKDEKVASIPLILSGISFFILSAIGAFLK